MIPIVYRWDDANAPVARGERRSLCDILYACLVTGYGSKLPAGWTREYVNATEDKAAFRNNPATVLPQSEMDFQTACCKGISCSF